MAEIRLTQLRLKSFRGKKLRLQSFGVLGLNFAPNCLWQPGHSHPSEMLLASRATLPETNSSPLKMGHPKRELVFQPSIFRCYVSFREGIYTSLWLLPMRIPTAILFEGQFFGLFRSFPTLMSSRWYMS